MKRGALAAVTAVLLLLVSLGATPPAPALARERVCRPDIDGTTCIVGVATDLIADKAAYQQTPDWCWAASMQMVFGVYGYRVSQRRIVSRIFGRAVTHTASDEQIDESLEGRYIDERGRRFLVHYRDISPQFGLKQMIGALENNHPLLLLTSHHTMVLSALTWKRTQTNNGPMLLLERAVVRDPYPYQRAVGLSPNGPLRRALKPHELHDVHRVIEVTVEPA